MQRTSELTMIQPAEEESEAEVRRVDQDNINKFARLNARLHELRDERDLLKVCKMEKASPLDGLFLQCFADSGFQLLWFQVGDLASLAREESSAVSSSELAISNIR